jgi:spermidine/putrescine transport system ATP-binding protein
VSDVELQSVTKAFKDTVAVDNLSLEVEGGEFFSLLGPSGCGKTTTLRMIGGFEEPTEGRVLLDGNDVTRVPPYKRDVNTVFQSYALFPHFDVFENVAYGLKRKNVSRGDIARRVEDILNLVDLHGLGHRRQNQLSGGQQQRVALARALVNRPKVLLLDEPLGALDLKLRKQMQLELKRIQAEVGITFIYVTHDQEEAMTMSNRIGVMNAGRLEQLGAPQDVYELPATEFVASFLGASNLLPGEVASRNGTMATISLRAGTSIAVPVDRLPAPQGPVSIGVRPEKIAIRPADETAEATLHNVLEATVMISTYTGVSTSYECKTDDGATVIVYSQNLGGPVASVGAGQRVLLTWEPQHTFAVVAKGKLETAVIGEPEEGSEGDD